MLVTPSRFMLSFNGEPVSPDLTKALGTSYQPHSTSEGDLQTTNAMLSKIIAPVEKLAQQVDRSATVVLLPSIGALEIRTADGAMRRGLFTALSQTGLQVQDVSHVVVI